VVKYRAFLDQIRNYKLFTKYAIYLFIYLYNYLSVIFFLMSPCLSSISVAGRIMVKNMEGNHDLIRGNAPRATRQCQREPQNCLSVSIALLSFFFYATALQWAIASTFTRFLDHTRLEAPQLVGLLWTSDQPDAETSTRQHTTLPTDRHPCSRLDTNPQSQQASGRRPTP